jgi:putative heme-binding domain-containing protein
LQDPDNDGVADKRDVLYGPFDTSRDTHGMNNSFTRGYDGYLYATHGFNNQSHVTAADGSKLDMTSGNIYRMALDGSHLDHITHGPINPFGLAFDALGNLYVADCHTKPFQQVLRGAWFEHFGRPHDGIGFYPKIMGHLHGSTAIGGVVAIDDDRWPEEFRGNLICGNPVTSRVNRDAVEWTGATPAAKERPDLVISDDPWFRPVAFALSPDGSIYVADFYNRIIGHYEVPLNHPGRDRSSGRIWRIVPPATNPAPQPVNFATAPLPKLIEALNHPNVAARLLALNEIVDRFDRDAAVPVRAAMSQGKTFQKSCALWILQRLGELNAKDVELAAADTDRIVRAHLMRVLGAGHVLTPQQRPILLAGLGDVDPLVRRCAAESLARRPARENIRPLLAAIDLAPQGDSHLVYAIRLALRTHFETPELFATIINGEWSKSETASINSVLPAIKTPAAAGFLAKQLPAGDLPGIAAADAVKHVASFGSDTDTDAAVTFIQQQPAESVVGQMNLMKAVQEGAAQRGGKLSERAIAFAGDVTAKVLGDGRKLSAANVQSAADLAKALALRSCAAPLAKLMTDPKADASARLAAARVILALDPQQSPGVAAIVADTTQSDAIREAAAKSLVELNTDEARQSLIMPIRVAPHALAVKLSVALASRPEGAAALLDNIERNNLSARLLQEAPVKDKLAAAKVKDLDARIAALTRNLAPADAQLDQLIAKRKLQLKPAAADVVKGREVFAKTCAACHQIDGQGAVVGPQLDGVGARGVDRLLEDVIDPNRNVDPAFRYSNITLTDGQTVSGLVRGEAGQTLTVVDSTGRELKLDKAEIQTHEPSKLSLMPTGFGEIIAPDDFNNLVAFLLSKTPPHP